MNVARDARCPLCQNTFRDWMTMPIDPKKEAPCRFGHLYRCSSCSFGMVLPRPSPEDMGEFYQLDNYYTHGRSHLADPGARTLADRIRLHLAWRMDFSEILSPSFIHNLVKGQPSDVCDIGCGTAKLALEVMRLGHRAVGVEVDRNAIQVAEKTGVPVHEGSIEHLPQAVTSRQFDVVIMSHVLEHVLEPVQAVETVKTLLRPGGYFICAVPNNRSAGAAHAGLAWEPLDVPRHLNFFVPENLRAICTRVGLEPCRLFFSGYCRQFSNEWINTERRIFDAIVRQVGGAPPGARKNSKLRAWWLLARTGFASRAAKYDQVGIIAKKV